MNRTQRRHVKDEAVDSPRLLSPRRCYMLVTTPTICPINAYPALRVGRGGVKEGGGGAYSRLFQGERATSQKGKP